MKTCLTVFLVIFLLSAAASADGIKKVDQPQGIPSFLGYVPDRLIVVMKPNVSMLNVQMTARAVAHVGEPEFDQISDRFAVSSITKQFPGSERKSAELSRYYKIKIEAGALEDVMEAYRNHPMVERVEPIGIHAMYATPNDGYYSYQWHLNQTSDHDIDAPEAWSIESGNTSIILGILDSGTRYYHPDLGGVNASPSNPGASRGNMWINTAELNGSAGVDDDGNGYVDDWIGYDFIQTTTNCWSGEDCNTKDNDPRDFNGHGTHTSGIFGMITNDGYGMCGVAGGWGNGTQTEYGNGVKIMPLRMGYSYNYLGQEYGVVLMDAAAEAFYYAANNGAKIASCSWGSSNSGGIAAAVTYFLNAGGIIFVAAGNDGGEVSPDYLNGRGDCISVAATDENDNGASFTTYGTWVDICAPGNNIYSTYHDHTDPNTNYWAAMGGTSMATPMAAGVGALIWSHNPSWTAAQVKSQLYSSADNINAYLSSKYIGKMGAGRINAYNAVNTVPTPPVANFSGSPTSGTVPLTVNFTDLSTGSITSWSWTFGDGGTSTSQNPSHQYTSTGTFTVSLTVTGPDGSDGETKTDYITVNPCVAPTANFIGSPTSGYAPLTVSFTDQSTGSPTSWSWNFGDGGTSTAQNPSHVYAAGTYTVTLTVTNACGSDEEVKTNYITVTTPPQQCDDFSDGNISNWVNKLGTWTATGGYMKGNSNTNNARTTSPFGSYGSTSINCDIRMNTGRTSRIARIIFAYQNASNYRFVQFDDVYNRIRIYDRVNNSNNLKASANVSMSSGVWYNVTVTIASGGTVSVLNNGTTLLSYNFGNVITGLVGAGFDKSNTDFDDFCVGGVSGSSDFASLPGENMKLLADEIMPENFSLSQNHPNPFNLSTMISFSLPDRSEVNLTIYNLLGEKVKNLVSGTLEAGSHTVTWDGTNESGSVVASGIYFYKLTSGDNTLVKKMSLLK